MRRLELDSVRERLPLPVMCYSMCALLYHQQYLFHCISHTVFSVTLSGISDEALMAQLSQATIAGVMAQLSPMLSEFSAMLVAHQQAQSSPLRSGQLGSGGADHSPADKHSREQFLQRRDKLLLDELRAEDDTGPEVFMTLLTQVLDEERSDNHGQVQCFSVANGPLRAGFVLAIVDASSIRRHAHDLHVAARSEWFRQLYVVMHSVSGVPQVSPLPKSSRLPPQPLHHAPDRLFVVATAWAFTQDYGRHLQSLLGSNQMALTLDGPSVNEVRRAEARCQGVMARRASASGGVCSQPGPFGAPHPTPGPSGPQYFTSPFSPSSLGVLSSDPAMSSFAESVGSMAAKEKESDNRRKNSARLASWLNLVGVQLVSLRCTKWIWVLRFSLWPRL